MMNFKQEQFEGTLLDLIMTCNRHVIEVGERIKEHHDWMKNELSRTPNLLPIRKGHVFKERGRRVDAGSRTYLIADNEPLASQLEFLLDQGKRPVGTFRELLYSGKIAASWKADVADATNLAFRGVSSSFRKRGLKLAHVFDAADGLDKVGHLERQMELRFLRSQSPLNVFLFPSPRVSSITVMRGFNQTKADLGEDRVVRSVALGYLVKELKLTPEFWNVFRSGIAELDLEVLNDWERIGREIDLLVRPRLGSDRQGPRDCQPRVDLTVAKDPTIGRQAPVRAPSGTRWTTPRTALTPDEAIGLLRAWLTDHPEAAQLDGSRVRKNNPAQWLHLRISGFGDETKFASRYGPIFDGHDYNGVVNFHGDTPIEVLREFVELVDDAESILDVLSPSATFETRCLPAGKDIIKPKFALKGRSDGVEGFFMYHDEHKGKRIHNR